MITKERIALLSLTTMCASSAMAQITTNQSPNEPVPPPALDWRAAARDGCSTTHEAREFITNAVTGEVTDRSHRYIEIGSGLNYLTESGEWCPSEDLIELTADGGAAALRGPTKVRFNANLNTTGAISITTQSNRVFKTRPLAIVFRDAKSGRVAVLATLQDCVGELLPPNQVVYRGAFGALADIRLTYTKAAVESDLILLQQPKLPEGWDAQTTRLELWHEWLGAPTPRQTARPIYREADEALRQKMVDPDMEDQILDFGDLWFPTGAAFATDAASARGTNVAAKVRVPNLALDTNLLGVAKTWLSGGNRSVLVETLRWEDVQPKMGRLPLAAKGLSQAKDRLDCLNQLPASATASQAGMTVHLAQAPYSPVGVVLDYTTVVSGYSYSFNGGTTYYISSVVCFTDWVLFGPGCVIKYAPDAVILASGLVVCLGSGEARSILTSQDDDLFGDTLPWSAHCPSYAAGTALWDYSSQSGSEFVGLRIRWAQTGIVLGSEWTYPLVQDCQFEFCQNGVWATYGGTVVANMCGVGTPCGPNEELFNMDITDICAGDSDNNDVADSTEYQYFGGLGTLPGHVVGQLKQRTDTHTPVAQGSPNDEVIWSGRDDAAPGSYQWNSSCWIAGVTGLSSFSPFHDIRPDWQTYCTNNGCCYWYQGGGTLITPRHAVTITHMSPCFFQTPDRWVRFVGTNGQTHNVRVLACKTIGDYAIGTNYDSAAEPYYGRPPEWRVDNTCVLLLETNLPPSVGFARFLPSDVIKPSPWGGDISCLTRNLPGIGFNQLKQAFIRDWYYFGEGFSSGSCFHHSVWFPAWGSWWWSYPPEPAQCTGDYADVQGGDSGSPTWVLINNELVLIGVWKNCVFSTWIGPYVNQVNTVISNLDDWAWSTYGTNSPTGFTVTQYPW